MESVGESFADLTTNERHLLRNSAVKDRVLSLCSRSGSMRAIYLLLLGVVAVSAQRRLALPDPRSCANREYHQGYFVITF